MQKIPRLDLLFAGAPRHLQSLRALINDPFVFESAEALLATAQDSGVGGTEKLASATRPSKFVSMLSELRIANLFVRLGCSVELLADEAFGREGTYTPDLLVGTRFGEVLVEVVSGSHGHTDISRMIQDAIEVNELCFRTTVYLAEALSIPGINAKERGQAETNARATADKFIHYLKTRDAQASGSIEIDGTRFEYEPSPTERGYHSGGATAVHLVRRDEHAAKLLLELERKAAKQQRLPPERQSMPFVVAYDNRESELHPNTAYSALTGSRGWYSGSIEERTKWLNEKRAAYPKDLLAALSGPWSRLMEDWDYSPQSQFHLHRFGALFEQAWAQQLSAVLVTHVGGSVQWFPNPFAALSLQAPQLLELPLPTKPNCGESEAWTHPAWHPYP